MAYAAPQPDSERVFAEINAVLTRVTHYVSADSWDIRRLCKLADQLGKANEIEGANALGTIWQMTGDREKAVGYIDYAIANSDDPAFYSCSKISILANLGYFSEALSAFRDCSAPEKGRMTHAWEYGYICAAFRCMKSHLPKANKMKFDLGGLDTDTAVRAANVLEAATVTDEDVARILDVAGSVLRARKLFFVGEGLRMNVREADDSDPLIDITFDVAVSSKEVHAMYQEFVDQALASVPILPAVLSVSFVPWEQANERSAA